MNGLSWFADFYRDGGFYMHLILLTGVISLAFVAERIWVLWHATAWNGRKLLDDLVRACERGDVNGARNLSLQARTPLGKIAHAMLSSGSRDDMQLRASAEDAATLCLPPLTRNLSHLALLANVVTLLGLLGTVFGLITAFAAVGAADPSQRSALLASGISQKLNTTGFGLLIAVPLLVVHGWLVSRVEGIVQQADECVVRLSGALGDARESRRSA